MADNVAITAGSGTSIATDDVSGVHYQRVKLHTGEDGSGEPIGDTDLGASRALWVDPRRNVVAIQQTPTVSTSPAYTAKDAVGGLLTFANAARSSGGTCRVTSVAVLDKGQQMADLDLILFDRSITAPTDNAGFNPSDTEAGYCRGIVPISQGLFADLSTNSVATVECGLDIVLNGTDLFGVLVARGTPTYTSTSDLVVTVTVARD